MNREEYSKLFHETGANLVAFLPLLQCDEAVMKMIEVAVAAEREAIADMVRNCDSRANPKGIAAAIRVRGEK